MLKQLASRHDYIIITVLTTLLLSLYFNTENVSIHSALLEIVTKYCNLLEIMLKYTFSNLQLL